MNNTISFAVAETCQIMEPIHSNSQGNVHGGELMKIMDTTAGIAALKHALGPVVTARVDELEFHESIHVGDIVTCVAQLCYVGVISMQVKVSVYVHELKDYSNPVTALTAFFTMVHVVDAKPVAVPRLTPITDDEKEIYRLGEQKYLEIKSKTKK
jgi:acyl-CoA hydrolase